MSARQTLPAQARSKRVLRAALIAVAAVVPAWPNSCGDAHPAVNLAHSDAVFEARVLPGGREAEVLRTWKGSPPRVIEFWVWAWHRTKRLKAGQVWLAYAQQVPGRGYEAPVCRAVPQRWAQGDLAWLERTAQPVPPHNSIILRGRGLDTKVAVRLRSTERVIPLRNVGSDFFYADNLQPSEYRVEVPGFTVSPEHKLTVGPDTMYKSMFFVTAPERRRRLSGE